MWSGLWAQCVMNTVSCVVSENIWILFRAKTGYSRFIDYFMKWTGHDFKFRIFFKIVSHTFSTPCKTRTMAPKLVLEVSNCRFVYEDFMISYEDDEDGVSWIKVFSCASTKWYLIRYHIRYHLRRNLIDLSKTTVRLWEMAQMP